MIFSAAVTAIALLAAVPADGEKWEGFRGNNGSGVASSTAIPDSLDPEQGLMWRIDLPKGYSSPVIYADRIFTTGAEEKLLLTLALDRATGKELWKREIGFSGRRTGANSPAAPTPAVDDERVVTLFHDAGLVCYDHDGEELWQNELGEFNIPHGMSTSPLIHEDLVIVVVDQDSGSYIAAFDKWTGDEDWRVDRPGITHSYATPAIYTPDDGPAQLIVSGSLQVAGYALDSGEKIWWVDGAAWQTKNVPTVIGDICYINAYMVPSSEFGMPKITQSFEDALEEKDEDGDGLISRSEWPHPMLGQAWFIFDLDGDDLLNRTDFEYLVRAGHAHGGLFAIRLGGVGDVTESHVIWKYKGRRGLPDVPSPVVLDGRLYMIKEGGLLTSVDIETGKVLKQGRIGDPDRYFASPVAADGKVILASLSGQVAVIAGGDEWQELSVTDLEEEIWSTPAIVDDHVFIRTQKGLYCFQAAADG